VSVAVLPVAILILQPALTVLVSYQRASLVTSRTTRPITWATIIEVGSICLVLLGLVNLGWTGATAAACALLAGRMASGLYLLPKLRGASS
jgi:O-antigen/teichoic acid export membrane protein